MNSIALILNWWQERRQGTGRAADRLVDVAPMWAEIDRERSRADRNGTSLCLLVFPVSRHQVEPLAKRLFGRIRATDTAGRLSRQKIGVVLPETPREGARVLASHLRAMYEEHEAPTICIYEHPFSNLEVQSARPADASSADHDRDDGPMDGRREGDRQSDGEFHGDHERQTADDVPIHAMQALTAQRLPLWKRTLDILGATAGLVVLSPLLAAAAVAIKLTSPGPILFHQRRAGLAARPFTMWKLRTMVVDAEARRRELNHLNEQDGPAFKIADDPRVTRVGKWLRKFNVDELPQLYNVLRGEMSLVGPRPLPVAESRACHTWHQRRLDVTPGLTCYWQVKPRRNEVAFDDWVRMDVRYVRTRNIWSDLKLIGQTIVNLFARDRERQPAPGRTTSDHRRSGR